MSLFRLISWPNEKRANELQRLDKKNLHRIGRFDSEPICRLCGMDNEDIPHLIFQCETLTARRFRIYGKTNLELRDVVENPIEKTLQLLHGVDLLNSEPK